MTVIHAEELPFSLNVEYAQSAGNPVAVLWVTPQEGYHTYSHFDPDAAVPTVVTLRDAQGGPAEATVQYPKGEPAQDTFDPSKRIMAYGGRFPVVIRFGALPEGQRAFTADLSMLLCSSKNCVPIQRAVNLNIPETLPPFDASALQADMGKPSPASAAATSAVPAAPTVLGGAVPGSLPATALTPITSLSAVSAASPAEWRFTPRFPQDALEPTALGTALFLGLLAGLILNVMPCVLPVLTMKISALLSASGYASERERIARFREHNILFAAGILTWFLVLAICVGALGLAWGGLFQNTGLVYGLLILVFLLSLSLFDVFTLPVLDFKVGASSNPKSQAYLTGLVATLLATPCSGPLLGGVLGWAALQPLPVVAA